MSPEDRLSQRRTRLLDLAGLACWEWDPNDRKVRFSAGAMQQLGLAGTPETLDAGTAMAWVHAGDRKRLQAAFARLERDGGQQTIEFRLQLPAGGMRWVRSVFAGESAGDGAPPVMFGLLEDQTPQRRREFLQFWEARVLESVFAGRTTEETLERVVEGIQQVVPDSRCALLLYDEQAGVLRDTAGFSPPDDWRLPEGGLPVGPEHGACGAAAARRQTVICPDLEIDEHFRQRRRSALAAGLRAGWATPILDAGGALLGVCALYRTWLGEPLAEELHFIERSARILGVAIERERHLRELRAGERRFRGIFENAAIGIYLTDTEGHLLDFNEPFRRMLGYPRETLLGQVVLSLTHPDDRARNLRLFEDLVNGVYPQVLFEKRWLDHAGAAVWGRSNLAWVRGEDDPGRGYVIGIVEDIDDRVRAEALSLESVERLARTLEGMSEAFLTLDREWQFTYVNRSAEELLQRDREALLGKTVWTAFPEALGSKFEQESRQALKTGKPREFDVRSPLLQGLFGVRVLPSEDGLAVYFHDRTLESAMEAEIERQQQLAAMASRLARMGAWSVDAGSGRGVWSDEARAIFEQEPGIDLTLIELLQQFTVDAAERNRALHAYQDVLGGGSADFELTIRTARGNLRRLRVVGEPMRDASGRIVGVQGAVQDISAQFEAEQQSRQQQARLAELAVQLERVQDAIIVRDADNRIVNWNQGAERLYGWTLDEARGQRVEDLLYGDLARFHEADRQVRASGEWRGELSQRTRSGRELVVEGRWTRIYDDQGGLRSIVAINTDVTERRRNEAQMLRAQRLESIGTLAGGMAHDLNNVLAPILMSIDLLRGHESDPERSSVLDTLEQSARRGADLVRQVLGFARGVEPERQPLDPGELLEEIAGLIRETFPRNLHLQIECADNLPVIEGDRTLLHQVLLNLAINARDAMPKGGALVLRATSLPPGSSGVESAGMAQVVIEVEDSGEGMSADVLARIFDPFFTTKEPGQGTGLGLPTALAIVEGHGGQLRVYSEPDVGTRFRVELPAGTCTRPAPPVAAPAESVRGAGECVLVVDDEPAIRQVTGRILERAGYRVLPAADGAEAVALFSAHRADVAAVLTDMMMPTMDGPALIQVLRRLDPDLPIIAASGLGSSESEARVRKLGVQRFLPKPYSAEALLQLLREALAERQASSWASGAP